jgi:hypothetical protein
MQILKNLIFVLFLVITGIYFIGCEAKGPTAIDKTSTTYGQQSTNTMPRLPLPPGFIIMALWDQPDLIPILGPNGDGWRGIVLHYDDANLTDTHNKVVAAQNAGYSPIILDIQRDWVATNQTSRWGNELWNCYCWGVNWFCVDDALSSGAAQITSDQILQLSQNIHAPYYGMHLMAIEFDINKMEQHPGWHNPVDAIYFYNYWVSTPSALANYLQRVRAEYPGKSIIPGLGWNAENNSPYQGANYIEAVKPYASSSWISYFTRPDDRNGIINLTAYLLNNHYLIPMN